MTAPNKTIPALLFARVDQNADDVAFWWREDGRWRSRTYRDSLVEIARIARALADRGVTPGTPVVILSETRPEWSAIDFAILCLGATTVGIYPALTAQQVGWQIEHSEAKVVVVEDAAQALKLARAIDSLGSVAHVMSIDPVSIDAELAPLTRFARDGRLSSAADLPAADVDWLRACGQAVRPSDLATIIYTSGTTGDPKGAMLTHANFWEVAHATLGLARVEPGDRGVIFLPLAHSLQRFTLYRALLEPVVGIYADSIEELPAALAFGRPTVLASVPRMLEKIKDKANAAVRERGGVAVRLFEWAFAVGRRRAEALEHHRRLSRLDRLQVALADRIVFRRIRERMGGELRILACGGAALDPEVARWYLAMGILVLEGWGLTETSAPATVNREDDFRLGTVGKPLPGVDVKTDTDGELLVRGPGIFVGYYKDPAATAAAIQDGWFRTGDIGTIDADGFVRITDRKKEILVTAGGKNIPPVNVEKRIERSPYVAQAVVIGDAKPYLVALIVPEPDAIEALAREQGWPEEPLAARLARADVSACFERAIADANRDLAKFEQLKRFRVLPASFAVESGELTPTLKLKRRVIAQKYRTEIEALYSS